MREYEVDSCMEDRGMAVPFFTGQGEKVQRESKAAFYGQTTVLSTWRSGLNTGILSTASLGSGLATSTARQEEKIQGGGRLFLQIGDFCS